MALRTTRTGAIVTTMGYRKMCIYPNESGFTLIELMVVVIVAVLTAIAIPLYYQYMREAQATAVVTNTKSVTLNVGTGTGICQDSNTTAAVGRALSQAGFNLGTNAASTYIVTP
ncbi:MULTISPECIES: prepilin-type N-terminal cleavage/methylation domain-containing protein [unclassified Acidithiobacillus]|uniref:prepilin-type N-terminal cleavage/methylation domain-containing protein n=1 Tax=unclassified Acidithiobacillus TaxID=2614800 RepID=UPI0029D419FE|nr:MULTISPECIES: prepilin-type N-terminal cleavage/methylation domain-containing protein [unclassified Acidithiobacillus]